MFDRRDLREKREPLDVAVPKAFVLMKNVVSCRQFRKVIRGESIWNIFLS